MIVDPDFLDHWRTRMLVDALGGDEMAPMCLLRLWAHCQVRRSDRFKMPAAGLKAQCRFAGDAASFEAALIDGKYIERQGDEIEVLGWAEQNASLLAAWENGNKGGRPKKEPKQNPRVTQGEPSANPALTHGEPIRVDKSREDNTAPPNGGARPQRKCPVGFAVSEQMQGWAAEHAPGVDVERETAKLMDYTFPRTISDWPGAWRNWMRKAFDDAARGRPRGHGPPDVPAWRAEQKARNAAYLGPAMAGATTPFTENDDATVKRLG